MSSDIKRKKIVVAIQEHPVSDETPSTNDVLQWDGSQWKPTNLPSPPAGFTAGGDLIGDSSSQNVISLTGNSGKINISNSGNIITWQANVTSNCGLKIVASDGSHAPKDLIIGAQDTNPDVGSTSAGRVIINGGTASNNGGNGGNCIIVGGNTFGGADGDKAGSVIISGGSNSSSSTAVDGGNIELQIGDSGIGTKGFLKISNIITDTSAGIGGASALPATPEGYIIIVINGTPMKLPYYPMS